MLRAIAHILLAKMYRRPIDRETRRTLSPLYFQPRRQAEGSPGPPDARTKANRTAQGHTYDLEAIFDDLNGRFFHGLLARPRMTWSRNQARNRLGHYDPAHNAIVVSRVFDHPRVPRYAVEYIVYHEMLHLKHPVKTARQPEMRPLRGVPGGRKTVSPTGEAKQFLKQL